MKNIIVSDNETKIKDLEVENASMKQLVIDNEKIMGNIESIISPIE